MAYTADENSVSMLVGMKAETRDEHSAAQRVYSTDMTLAVCWAQHWDNSQAVG